MFGAYTINLTQVKNNIVYDIKTRLKCIIQISDLQSIGQEEWIVFRGKAYKNIMDFIMNWQEKLKDVKTSPLSIKIHNELETLKVIIHK